MDSIQELIVTTVVFINSTLIPFLMAVALVSFLANVARYFVVGSSDVTTREKAKDYALWSVIALVTIVGMWGIVNILVSGLGLDQNRAICPDYNPDCHSRDHTPDYFEF